MDTIAFPRRIKEVVDIRIIHTSDIHLNTRHPERIEALKNIVEIAEEYDVDLMTISGDLFDTHEEAEKMRIHMRPILSNNSFKIFACPGNHDSLAYKNNLDFGSDFEALGINGIEERRVDDNISITAMPYQERPTTELLASLKSGKSCFNILLMHCTLDIGFSKYSFGDDENSHYSYFPVTLSQLESLEYDLILAGHFHKEGIVKPMGKRGRFIYPGSPASITSGELGRRQAYIIDIIEGDKVELFSVPLKSYYVDRFSAFLLPENQSNKLSELEEWLADRADAGKLFIELTGYIEGSERDFRESISDIIDDNAEVYHGYTTIEHILKHDLYDDFMRELHETELTEDMKLKVKRRFLEAFSLALTRSGEGSK